MVKEVLVGPERVVIRHSIPAHRPFRHGGYPLRLRSHRRTLWGPPVPGRDGAVSVLQRRFEPPLHVEEHPWQFGVLRYRAKDEVVVQAVEEGPDVEIDHPVRLLTAQPAARHRIESRAPRAIAIGVGVEQWLHLRL